MAYYDYNTRRPQGQGAPQSPPFSQAPTYVGSEAGTNPHNYQHQQSRPYQPSYYGNNSNRAYNTLPQNGYTPQQYNEYAAYPRRRSRSRSTSSSSSDDRHTQRSRPPKNRSHHRDRDHTTLAKASILIGAAAIALGTFHLLSKHQEKLQRQEEAERRARAEDWRERRSRRRKREEVEEREERRREDSENRREEWEEERDRGRRGLFIEGPRGGDERGSAGKSYAGSAVGGRGRGG